MMSMMSTEKFLKHSMGTMSTASPAEIDEAVAEIVENPSPYRT